MHISSLETMIGRNVFQIGTHIHIVALIGRETRQDNIYLGGGR